MPSYLFQQYVGYKESVLAYYDQLLREQLSIHETHLVNALKDAEEKHHQALVNNRKLQPLLLPELSSIMINVPAAEHQQLHTVKNRVSSFRLQLFDWFFGFSEKKMDEHGIIGQMAENERRFSDFVRVEN